MDALRTPDARFEGLPGSPFPPHFVHDLPGFAGLRMHHVDEGPRDAEVTFLCLHGQPTWSYLYRKMIPVFASAGHRVIAPDLFGFGRSDKPTDEAVYTFDFHRDSLLRLIEHLDLRNVVLVCQDWGGLLGLTLPMDLPGRFTRLLAMNTTLATGDVRPGPESLAFLAWRAYSRRHPDLDAAALVRFSEPSVSPEEAAAYNAPFPDARFKAGVRRFPDLVPTRPDAPGAAAARRASVWWQALWEGESFLAVGARDALLGERVMRDLAGTVRGAPAPMVLPDAGHFVQESGEPIARAALRAFRLG